MQHTYNFQRNVKDKYTELKGTLNRFEEDRSNKPRKPHSQSDGQEVHRLVGQKIKAS